MSDVKPTTQSPFYLMQECNAPIELYSGRATVKTSTYSVDVEEVRIEFQWLPTMGPKFEFEANTSAGIPPLSSVVSDDDPVCQIELGDSPHGEITGYLGHQTTSNRTIHCRGWINDWPEAWTSIPVSQVLFHVANYMDFFGSVTERNGRTAQSRAELKIGEFDIIFDGILSRDEHRTLQSKSGFQITHVGTAVRTDGESFTLADFDQTHTALYQAMSFTNGRRCGPLLAVGSDVTGEPLCFDWRATKTEPARNVSRWASSQKATEALGLSAKCLELQSDPIWSEMFWTAMFWYLAGNASGASVESRIVFTQLAFEGLSEALVVEDRALLPADQFRGLNAAKRIEHMLTECGIPNAVPNELQRLHAASEAANRNAVEMLTYIRNSLIHPTRRNRDRLLQTQIDTVVEREAGELSLYWFELVLLRLLDFDGSIWNRTTCGPAWHLNRVPWASNQA